MWPRSLGWLPLSMRCLEEQKEDEGFLAVALHPVDGLLSGDVVLGKNRKEAAEYKKHSARHEPTEVKLS